MHARTPTTIVLVTLLALVPAMPAASEPAPGRPDAAGALAQVRPGLRVRIQDKDGRVVEGRYLEIADGDVVLDEPAARIAATSIQRVWLRGRAARKGAIIGGTVLGATGALLGLLVAAYCASENECGGGVWFAAPAAGFGLGAAAGAVTGGLAGAAIPKWHPLDRGASIPPPTNRVPVPDRAGTLSPWGGGAKGHDRDSATRGRGLHFNEFVSPFGSSLAKTRDCDRLRPYGLAGLGHCSEHGFDAITLTPDFDYAPLALRDVSGDQLYSLGFEAHCSRLGAELADRLEDNRRRLDPRAMAGPIDGQEARVR